MSQNTGVTIIDGADTAGGATLYDRFARLYDITFKFNRYGHSVERYLRERALPLAADAEILDAGCGTGLLTLALLRALPRPARVTAIDLSAPSLVEASQAVSKKLDGHSVNFVQANLLALPFAAESFDFITTSGALEYVPLGEGLAELARVLRPGGHLLHFPVRPAPASKLLEIMFRFKTHPPREVDTHTLRHFQIVERHRFTPLEPIGWTKLAILARKP